MYCGLCALEEMTQLYFTRVCVNGAYAGVIINKTGISQIVTQVFAVGNASFRIFAGILGPVPLQSLNAIHVGATQIDVSVYNQSQIGTGDGTTTTFTSHLAPAPIGTLLTIMNGATQIDCTVDSLGNVTGVGLVSGTINKVTGALTVTFSAAPALNNVITARYTTADGGGSIVGTGITSGDIDYVSGVIHVTFDTPPASGAQIAATFTSANPSTPIAQGVPTETPEYFPVSVNQEIGTGDNLTPTFAATLAPAPIVQLLSIAVGTTTIPVTVDSLGNVSGQGIQTGTLVADDGALEITFVNAPGTGITISANFIGSDSGNTAFMIYAENPGVWANNLKISIIQTLWDPEGFQLVVYENQNGIDITREVWDVSRIKNKKDGYGNNMYLETAINGYSNFIRVFDNVDLDQNVMPAFTTTKVPLTMGSDGQPVTSGDIIQGWQLYGNAAYVDMNILINGGYVSDIDWSVQESMQALVERRRDCFAVFDIPYNKVEITPITMASDWRLNYQNIESSFCALYSPWVKVYDSYNDIAGMPIPPSGFIAQVMARTDNQAYPWYAPAGYNRGVIRSQTLPPVDVTVRYDAIGDIEALYQNPVNINPLIFSPGDGIVVFGQKTQQSKPSALDRINVRRCIITIERAAKQFLKFKLFELNNQYTRLDITNALNQYLSLVQAQNGLYAYKTVCDETNNPPQVIDMNQLNVDIYLQPEKAAEFIQLQNIITATGVNFSVIQALAGFNLLGATTG